jgi:hypothetical protein
MFHCSIGSQNYAEIYEICFGFAVNSIEALPTRICNDCEQKLISFNTFRLNVEDVETKISNYMLSEVGVKRRKVEEPEENLIEIIEPEENFCDDEEENFEMQEEFLLEVDVGEETKLEYQEEPQEDAEIQVEVEKAQVIEEVPCRFVPSRERTATSKRQ